MIHRAQLNGSINGLALVYGGIAIFQYADDTILFIQDDLNSAINLKLLLHLFEVWAENLL
jgi:hypothetical protein